MLAIALFMAQTTAAGSVESTATPLPANSLASCRVLALNSSPMTPPFADNGAAWQQQLSVVLRLAKKNLENAKDNEARLTFEKEVAVIERCIAQGTATEIAPQPTEMPSEQKSAG